jgi:hypothetical protein
VSLLLRFALIIPIGHSSTNSTTVAGRFSTGYTLIARQVLSNKFRDLMSRITQHATLRLSHLVLVVIGFGWNIYSFFNLKHPKLFFHIHKVGESNDSENGEDK